MRKPWNKKRGQRLIFCLATIIMLGLNGCASGMDETIDEETQTEIWEGTATNVDETLQVIQPTQPSESVMEASTQKQTQTEAVPVQDYPVTTEYVKIQGRYVQLQDTLWLTHSASGIEFCYEDCTRFVVKLVGDSMATSAGIQEGAKPKKNYHQARYAVYCNEELVEIALLTKFKDTIEFSTGLATSGTIRIVKLSESSDSSIGIQTISTDGTIYPMEDRELLLEFIGDSITCGYGVDGTLGDIYLTYNENAMKTYAYQTAEKLNADYTFVSFSGYGLYSGYTSNGTRNNQSLLPKYYDKLGNSYGSFAGGMYNNTIQWSFDGRHPDCIVINLGTNDASYCKTEETKEKFVEAYVDFLKMLRGYHEDAVIVCTLGIMGADLYPQVEEAVSRYQQETSDDKIHAMRFSTQNSADGFAVDYHPTEKTHQKAANQLVQYLKDRL